MGGVLGSAVSAHGSALAVDPDRTVGSPGSSNRQLHFFVRGIGTTSFHVVLCVVPVPTHHNTPCISITARSEHFSRHPPGGPTALRVVAEMVDFEFLRVDS